MVMRTKYRIKRKNNRYIPQKKVFLFWERFSYERTSVNDREVIAGYIALPGVLSGSRRFESVKKTESGYWPTDGFGYLALETFEDAMAFIEEYSEFVKVEKTIVKI